ncbi:glycosyltransferase [Carnobacterium sp. PL12RED10]|uniref:glycosyltransferase family 2 protein n=1 Tax=Carnobacterium sp. PL12RED10 TaxID=2592351 RepID=UPI0011EE9F75|nr:glycosyltransferase family 2 protein [Carnobacterium sp. PL12RED10]KAF3302255.1 glycosyltransferase [Carnobacterium sp. PL12RED10]
MVSSNPLVSVVVPIYNVEKYLKQCITSIINQEYKNLEILLVNDGSQDSSLQICNEFLQIDSRIKVYSHNNKGVGYTRNIGIKNFSGDFLVFCDSDDILDSKFLSKLIQSQNDTNSDLVLCNLQNFIEKEGIRILKNNQIIIDENGKIPLEKFMNKFIEYKTHVFFGSPDNKLYKGNIIREKSLRFVEHSNFAEDFEFNLDYYNYIDSVAVVNESLYYYRIDAEDSVSKTIYPSEEFLERYIYVYEKFDSLLSEYGYNETDTSDFMLVGLNIVLSNLCKQYTSIFSKKKIKFINRMVNCEKLINIINNLKVERLPFKYKVLLYLIKFKMVNTLNFFISIFQSVKL